MNLSNLNFLKDTSFLLLVIAILIAYIILFNVGTTEGLSDEAGFGMGNPFTDAACVDDSVPIITYNSGNISCISKDGNNCLMRDQLVPKMTSGSPGSPSSLPKPAVAGTPILCSNTGSPEYGIGINTWLSAPGIRATDGITKTTFNDLTNNGYTNLTCTAKGLNTSGHWCNNVYKKALENCNTPQDKIISQMNEQIRRTDVCGPDGALATFAKTSTDSGPDVTSNRFNYKEVSIASNTTGPSDSTIKKCNASCRTKVARSMKKLSAEQCKTNCSNCGNATC
jgi:hypothetical protein